MDITFWNKNDGIAVAEMITLLALLSIVTFSALPFYNKLITQTHRLEVETTYNRIKSSIIMSAVDSISENGIADVPFPSQIKSLSRIKITNSSSWEHDGSDTWTYLPTGAQIIYNRVKQNDYSLKIEF